MTDHHQQLDDAQTSFTAAQTALQTAAQVYNDTAATADQSTDLGEVSNQLDDAQQTFQEAAEALVQIQAQAQDHVDSLQAKLLDGASSGQV